MSVKFIVFNFICLIVSVFSFIYFYKMDYDFNLLVIINIVDFLLFVINIFIVCKLLEFEKFKFIINMILFILVYYSMFMGIGCYIIGDDITLNNIMNIFEFSIFLGPVFIILIPIYWIIGQILG